MSRAICCQRFPAMTVLNSAVPPIHKPSTESDDQILDELAAARVSGCPRRIAAAEGAVVLEYLPLASRIAHRHRGRGVELEDLIQVAGLGLVKAVRGWRPQPDGGFLP